jgi:hypothetical protein
LEDGKMNFTFLAELRELFGLDQELVGDYVYIEERKMKMERPVIVTTVMNHETNDAVRYVVAERRMCRRLTDFERDYMSWERRMADADS